jgi:hypothetical protein
MIDGVPGFEDYDGLGEDRVLFSKVLKSSDAWRG